MNLSKREDFGIGGKLGTNAVEWTAVGEFRPHIAVRVVVSKKKQA